MTGYFRTTLLLAALTGLFLACGWLLGGRGGMGIALVLALAMNFGSYWFSDRLVLAMHRARQVGPQEAPAYHRIVSQLAAGAGLPMPKLYIIDTPQPNAFATGRNPSHAALAATTGLLRMMDERELAGVMAHELAHVKHRDMLTMTVAAGVAGAISMAANMAMWGAMFGGRSDRDSPLGALGPLLVVIFAPLAAMLVQMAVSRSREYEADRLGGEICGNPLALASALGKLGAASGRIPNPAAEAAPATAHLFIANPLSGHGVDTLFSTHPPMEERIRRLRRQAGLE
jgi:heat shock protein HtpX